MVDERALEVVKEMLLERHGEIRHLFNYDDFAPRLIEAYEAAKWRPIEEAEGLNAPAILKQDDLGKSNYTYVDITTDRNGTYLQYDVQGTWTIEGWPRSSMFRTIDHTNQDAAKGAGDARQQPTEGKSSAS